VIETGRPSVVSQVNKIMMQLELDELKAGPGSA